ncbi:MAG: BrnT family toxin [Bryobacteraceae bacterium]
MALELEWDPHKAAANLAKHKVSFEEAATVFGDPLGGIVADPRHSTGEERLALLGLSQDRRLLAVMYVERGGAIRIIGARRATRRERRNYEEITQ